MSSRRWIILAMVFLGQFAFIFSMQAAPPLLPAIIKDFNLSHSAAAGVMLFVALPGVLLSIPAGLLADAYGRKRLCIAGLGLVCLGTFITAVAPSFSFLQVGRAIVGIGGALLFSAAAPLLFQWFSGAELGLAMGIFALTMPLATVISFNLFGRVELAYGWRFSLWIATALTALVLVLFAMLTQERKAARATLSPAALRRVPIWMLALIWCSFNMAAISLTTWGKTLFMDFKGLPPVQSDFLAGLLMLIGLASPFAGYLGGRLGRHRLLIFLSTLGMTACFVLIPSVGTALLVLLLIVLGLFATPIPPSVLALPPVLAGQESAALGFGVLATAMNCGVLVGPLVVGWVLDTTHSEVAAFSTMAFFAGSGAILTCLLKAK